jgi:hypothetical protein
LNYLKKRRNNMGLDQYFIAKKEGEEPIEIGYLRKHNWIHSWMQQRWIERGKPLPDEWDEERKKSYREEGDFNCIPLELLLKDIKQLMKNVREDKLKPVEGFFFGNGEPDEDTKKEELEILRIALGYVADEYAVTYDSWW